MNANFFKVSADYWNSLDERERAFLQENVCDYGLQYAKRVMNMATKVFPNWSEIAPLTYYTNRPFSRGVWIIFKDRKAIGTVTKSVIGGYGITEKITIKENDTYREIWNNWNGSAINKSVIKMAQNCIK